MHLRKSSRIIVMKTKRLRSIVYYLLVLIGILTGSNTIVLSQAVPPAVYLDEIIFTNDQAALDRDKDGLKDNLEYQLAEHIKPLLVFDSSEQHRLPHEPVVLFQVRPLGCIGSGCATPWKVGISFVFLFKTDGGYGPSSWCKDAHNGDAQSASFELESNNGQSWKLTKINNGVFTWPQTPVQWYQGTHATIYMSGHKHHQFFSTAYDEKNSPYSKWGCNDDVNGRGARIFPNLISSYPDRRYNNVGEPAAHSADYFINSLDAFGYPRENAWSTKPFTGGLPDQGGTSSVESTWMKNPFQFGNGFSTYVPHYTAVWRPSTEPEIQAYGWSYADFRAKYDQLWNQNWRLHILQSYVLNGQVRYNAVWRPSAEPEIQAYGWSYADFRAKYDQLWNQNWRLHILQSYVVNGEVRYNAVWRPSNSGEIQVYGWSYADFRAKYDQLWNQNWRLHILQAYVVNGEVRYNAVWRPSTSNEIQVYGWNYADFRTRYDQLWNQNWRLHILQAYVVNGEVRYNAVWRPSNSGEIQVYGWSYADFRAKYDELWNYNLRLHTLLTY